MISRDEEDDTWFEALAGRASGEHGATREASALRAALLHSAAADSILTSTAEVNEPSPDAAREVRLLERARAAGLLEPRRGLLQRRTFWSWPGFGAVTALACGAVIAVIVLRPVRVTEVSRGAAVSNVFVLRAADPVRVQRDLLGELRAAGVTAAGYERLGREGIDADLPRPLPARVRATLERYHIPVPADGTLQIEIARPATR
jgi:hypothetical protein